MDVDGGRGSLYNRLGPSSSSSDRSNNNRQQPKVCYHWLQGKCTRYPCSFLHSDAAANGGKRTNQGFGPNDNYYRGGGGMRRNGNSYFNSNNTHNKWERGHSQPQGSSGVKKIEKVCNFWSQGSCKHGDTCKYLHQWATGDCFTPLTKLEGHKQVVTGITLPSGSDKLFTGSQDSTVRVWDCQSGQVASVIDVGGAVGCMLSEGPWLFVGLPNLVKAWNIQTSLDLSLNGPVGQVYSLVVGNDLLFAGTQDGSILAWKFNVAANCFEPAASLKGHTLAVVTLVVGGTRMYSGSMDHSIRVWCLETLQCLQTLSGHTDVVMSVLCWDQFLISASLDQTIKVWGATESGSLDVTYTHKEEHGVITLCGMHDAEAKPVLLCSCNDNTIRVYELPSFSKRAKIFSKSDVRCIQIGPGGIFFTSEGTGPVKVWKWSSEPTTTLDKIE